MFELLHLFFQNEYWCVFPQVQGHESIPDYKPLPGTQTAACSKKAANQVPAIMKYIGTLNAFAKALKFSPKLTRCVEASKDEYNEKAPKINQAFFTRYTTKDVHNKCR